MHVQLAIAALEIASADAGLSWGFPGARRLSLMGLGGLWHSCYGSVAAACRCRTRGALWAMMGRWGLCPSGSSGLSYSHDESCGEIAGPPGRAPCARRLRPG